ncbi:MAG: hypothetical protein U0572_10350 [Phycisphaerales bacterium]
MMQRFNNGGMRVVFLGALGALGAIGPMAIADVTTIVSSSPTANGAFGRSVAGIPDVNGDTIADVIVGGPSENDPENLIGGQAHVYSGFTGELIRQHVGDPQPGNLFGAAVCGIGDINSDGRGDYLIGSPNANSLGLMASGSVKVYSGSNGFLIRSHAMPSATELAFFGTAVCALGDLNGDGRAEYIISAPGAGTGGRVYVYNGATGALIRTHLSPTSGVSGFGSALGAVPDVNNDGIGDYVIGAPYGTPSGSPTNAGRAYIYSGASGSLLKTLTSSNPVTDGKFGTSAVGIEDVNGDGRGDVAVGAPGESIGGALQAGRVYVFSGSSGALLKQLEAGIPTSKAALGTSVAAVDDRNGDGRQDLLVGAPADTAPGTVFMFSGQSGAFLTQLQSPVAAGGDSFGYCVATVPDANADGRSDYIIGAYRADPSGGGLHDGRAFLYRELANDACSASSAIPTIHEGVTFFSNIGAIGLGFGSTCTGFGFEADVWFDYVPACTGLATITTCVETNLHFDTRLAVYGGCSYSPASGLCDLSTLLACSNDGCGVAGGGSKVTVDVQSGHCYRIRIGGNFGAEGTGFLSIACASSCLGDINGNGTVDAADLAILLGAWGLAGQAADLDGSGIVDAADLAMLLGAWGEC